MGIETGSVIGHHDNKRISNFNAVAVVNINNEHNHNPNLDTMANHHHGLV